MNPPALSMVAQDAAERQSLFQRAVDFLFGYDFFISYAWCDARPYAVALAEQLRAQGFECFLDSRDYAKGEDWRRSGRRALRRTARLLLLGSPGALQSDPVLQEFRAYQECGRLVVPIDFGGTLTPSRKAGSPLLRELSPNVLRIAESLDRLPVGPSPSVVQEIRDGFRLLRQQQRRLRWFATASAVFALIAAVAVVASILAERRRREAVSRGLGAQATIEADRQLDLALLLAARADSVKTTAQSSAGLLGTLHRAPVSVFLHNPVVGSLGAMAAHPLKPDLVATVDWFGNVALWDLAARRQLDSAPAGSGQLYTVAFSPDGRWLAAGGADKQITLWHPDQKLRLEKPIAHPRATPIRKLLFLDEHTLLVAADGPSLATYDLTSGTWVEAPAVHTAPVSAMIRVAGNPSLVITGASDGRALVWPVGPAGLDQPRKLPAGDWVLSAAVSPDRHWLALGLHDKGLQIWDLKQEKCVSDLPASRLGGNRLFTVGFLSGANSLQVYCCGDDGTMYVLNGDLSVVQTYAVHRDAVLDAAWTADGSRMVTAGRDGKLAVWDFTRPSPIAQELF